MARNYKVGVEFDAKDGLSRRFGLMDRAAARFGRTSERSFKRASRGASRFKSITSGILAANLIERGFRGMTSGLASFITEASKIEDAQAGFTPLLGSVDRAQKLVEKLNQTAATTPFQFEGIADVAKQLLPVMNGSIENTVDTFRMLGDTAGGNIQKLDSITRGYTKALLKGKPDMEALNMIAEAGVPIFSEMANNMGITKAQLFEMSKQGKLTSDDLTKTFKKMTSEGGIFFKGMEIASETLSGVTSTLKDNIALTAATLGQTLFPMLKEGGKFLITVAQQTREWAIANQGLIGSKISTFVTEFKNTLPTLISLMETLWTVTKGIGSAFFWVGDKIGYAAAKMAEFLENPNVLKVMDFINTGANQIGGGIMSVGSFIGDTAGDIGGGIADFFGGGEEPARQAPNAAEANARAQQSRFQGTLNINGAPAGSSVTTERGVSGFDLALQGAN